MATYIPAKRATAFKFFVSLVSQANTKLMQVNPTLAAGDAQVSKDGGAFANLTTLPAVTPAGGRAVQVDLSGTEMTADNVLVQFVDAAGSEWCDLTINIPTAARQIDDLAYPATSGRSMVVDAAGLVDANAVKVGPTGSGTAQTAGDLKASMNTIDDFVDAEIADIQARLPAALTANGNMKSSMVEILTTALTETVGQLAGGFKKFFNIAAPVSTMDVVARVTLTDTVTTYTGNTVQTGDAFARLGLPAGASVSADILVIDNFVDDIESRLGTPANLGSGATVAANLSDIEGQTDDIGIAGAGLTAVPWNAAWDAEVESEVVDALETRMILRRNTSTAGGASTITLDAGANATNDYYKNLIIGLVAGTGAGQGRIITGYVGGTKVATVNTPWVTQPGADSVFVLLPFDAIPGASAPTAAEVADAVWDEDATAHQTLGSFGQAIGDPVADTNTIFKAVVTDASGATVGTDTTTLVTRVGTPTDLGGGASVALNLSDIEAQTDDIGVAGAGLTAIVTGVAHRP